MTYMRYVISPKRNYFLSTLARLTLLMRSDKANHLQCLFDMAPWVMHPLIDGHKRKVVRALRRYVPPVRTVIVVLGLYLLFLRDRDCEVRDVANMHDILPELLPKIFKQRLRCANLTLRFRT